VVEFGTPQWLDTYRDSINASTAYREAAAGWEGAVGFIFEAEPDRGWPETKYALMDLWHGECRSAEEVDTQRVQQAPFVVRAPYTRWKQIVRAELDPIKALMQGKVRLRGNLAVIVKHVKAANELVRLASEVPTTFPDDGAAGVGSPGTH